jgi:hypothetical protein
VPSRLIFVVEGIVEKAESMRKKDGDNIGSLVVQHEEDKDGSIPERLVTDKSDRAVSGVL